MRWVPLDRPGSHTALVTGVQLQDCFFVRVPKQLSGKTEDRGGFANAGHARNDNVGHVSILGDYLETFNSLRVANYVV